MIICYFKLYCRLQKQKTDFDIKEHIPVNPATIISTTTNVIKSNWNKMKERIVRN